MGEVHSDITCNNPIETVLPTSTALSSFYNQNEFPTRIYVVIFDSFYVVFSVCYLVGGFEDSRVASRVLSCATIVVDMFPTW